MISPERTGLLKSFLGSLPEQIAARLAQAVEVDRLVDGKSLPHEMILESLRPALRRSAGRRSHADAAARCSACRSRISSRCMPRKAQAEGPHRARQRRAGLDLGQPDAAARRDQGLYPRIQGAHPRRQACRRACARRQPSGRSPPQRSMRDASSTPARPQGGARGAGRRLVVADADEMALLLGVGADVMEIQRTAAQARAGADRRAAAGRCARSTTAWSRPRRMPRPMSP